MLYRIVWENRATTGVGQGDVLYTNQEEAQKLADLANIAYHEMVHTVIEEKRS